MNYKNVMDDHYQQDSKTGQMVAAASCVILCRVLNKATI